MIRLSSYFSERNPPVWEFVGRTMARSVPRRGEKVTFCNEQSGRSFSGIVEEVVWLIPNGSESLEDSVCIYVSAFNTDNDRYDAPVQV